MKRTLLFLILCFVVILMAGCSHRKAYPEVMQQAVAVMNQYPDSARRLLAPLESTLRQEPEETRIYYRLLTVKADYKCYIVEKSDSAIRAVVNYYERHADPAKLTEAYYYQGCVNKDLGDAPKALHAFQQAASAGADGKDYYLLGRIYNEMGMLYAYQNLPQEALKAQRRALSYIRISDILNVPYILRDIGRAFDVLSESDSALHYYGEGIKMALAQKNRERANVIRSEIVDLYLKKGKIKEAQEALLATDLKDIDKIGWGVHYSTCGDYYKEVGQLDSAFYCYKQSLQEQKTIVRLGAFYGLSQIEKQRGHYKEAMMYADSAQHYWEKSSAQTNAEAMARMTAVYNYQQTMNRNAQLEEANLRGRMRAQLLWAAVALLGCGIVILIMYQKKRRNEQREAEANRRRAEEVNRRATQRFIEEEESRIRQLKEEMGRSSQEKALLETKIRELETIVEHEKILHEMKKLTDEAIVASDIYALFHNAPHEGPKPTPDDWRRLREELDKSYDRFTTRLFHSFHDLTPDDINFCCLLKIGLKGREIAVIQNVSESAVSHAKKKLTAKMFGPEAEVDLLDRYMENV